MDRGPARYIAFSDSVNESPIKRILAVDLRSTRVGFAVIETPLQLVDWGKRALPADSCAALLVWLLHRYGITVIVIRGITVGSRRDTVRVRGGLRAIRRVARSSPVQLVVMSKSRFKRVFEPYGRNTRYGLARLMTVLFPELARFLPRPRRCYEPENRRMSAFDAVALAVAFLAVQPESDSLGERLASAAEVLSAAPQ